MMDPEQIRLFIQQYIHIIIPFAALIFGILEARRRGNTKKVREQAMRLETRVRERLVRYGLPDYGQTRVDSETVKQAVEDAIPEDAEVTIKISDGNIFAPTRRPELLGLAVAFLPYRPSRFDCEDFSRFYAVLCALVFGVNSIGVATTYSGGHAFNIIVYADGSVEFVEPQDNDVVTVDPDNETYNLNNALIRF